MSGPLFYERPNGEVYIGFFYRGIIGLDHNTYLLWKKELTKELEDRIKSKLQDLWKTDKEKLISLVRGRKSKQIYDLFEIPGMINGWSMERWYKSQKQKEQEAKTHNNLIIFEYYMNKQTEKKVEDRKWKLFLLKCQVDPSCGIIRVKRLHQQVKGNLRRSYSMSDLSSDDKIDEYPFSLEKWGLSLPIQVEIPEFMKLKENRRKVTDKKKRNAF